MALSGGGDGRDDPEGHCGGHTLDGDADSCSEAPGLMTPPHDPRQVPLAQLWGSTCRMAETWAFELWSPGDTCGRFSRLDTKMCRSLLTLLSMIVE